MVRQGHHLCLTDTLHFKKSLLTKQLCPYFTKYCYSDTYESLTHNTKITFLLVFMQLHLNPSFKGNQKDIFVTQCVSDLIRYIYGVSKLNMELELCSRPIWNLLNRFAK